MEKVIFMMVQRWVGEQPKIMRILMYISIVATAVSGIPGLLEYLCTSELKICIEIPVAWSQLYNQIIVGAGIVFSFLTKMQVTAQAKQEILTKQAKQESHLN